MAARAEPPMSIADQATHFLTRVEGAPPPGPVRNRAAWYGRELGDVAAFATPFPRGFLAAFERGADAVAASGLALDDLVAEDAPFEAFADLLAGWRAELSEGRGFLVLRGAPIERWDTARQKLFMRLLGLQFGRLGLQNPQGDVIGEVRDTGAAKRDPFARLYATAGEFRFHCDASDLVGLMCVRPAKSGGESKIASSVTVYNEVLARRPDLAPRLFQPLLYDLRNEQQAGMEPYTGMTPCAHSGGILKTFYISDYFRTVERHGIAIPPADRELLDLYDAIAGEPGIGLSFYLEPGDVQILYNHTTLHARTAFEDAPGAERLLLRFLVSIGPNAPRTAPAAGRRSP